MMKKFEIPEIELIRFNVEDVITASGEPTIDEGDLGGNGTGIG